MTEAVGSTDRSPLKKQVEAFWQEASCGEQAYASGDTLRARLDAQAQARYELEPYLAPFARFEDGAGKDVCEVGVGMGADHLRWAQARPRSLSGVDLTPRAVQFTGERLAMHGLASDLRVADAEHLPFADGSFDLVYSWGVLHHTPDTDSAFQEVARILRPGGVARIMVYHTYSLVGAMLWARYGLLTGRPLRPLRDIYAQHLESPGTKAYTLDEGRHLMRGFRQVTVSSRLSFGDLLEGAVGQRHGGMLLRTAKAIYPRALIRRALPTRGLYLLLEGVK